jgi:hypothetical protein
MHISATVKHRFIEGLIGLFLVVVSLVSLRFIKLHGADWTSEWLIAVVGFFVPFVIGDLLLVRTEVGELRASNENLRNALSTILQRSIPDLAFVIKHCSLHIPGDKMPAVWAELCWLVQDNYKATNWMLPESIYEQPWGKAALDIQCCKSWLNIANIQKVLIVQNETELNTPKLEKRLREQVEAGITIRYIEHAELSNLVPLKPLLDSETIDFGIFDDRYILLWIVDKERHLTGGRLIVDQAQVAGYSNDFDQLLTNSKIYKACP